MHQRSLMSLHLCSKIKVLERRRNQCQGFNCNVLLYFLLCCFGGQEYNEYRMIHDAGEELKYHHPKCDSFQKNFYCLFVGWVEGYCCKLPTNQPPPSSDQMYLLVWHSLVDSFQSLTEEGGVGGGWILSWMSNHSSQALVCKFVLILCMAFYLRKF